MQNHFVGSQATDNGSWLKGPKGSCTCSKCGNNVNNFHRELHEYKCWGKGRYIPSLDVSDSFSFDYCSLNSVSVSSESSSFELIDNTPSLTINCASIIDIIGEEISSTTDNDAAVTCFDVTEEDCASFNGTLKQTCAVNQEQAGTFNPAIEPFSVNYSTDNEEDAIKWFDDNNCEKIPSVYHQWKVLEDRPTGKYVKAMFSIPCENSSEKNQKIAILHDTIKHHLKQYSIDYSDVNAIGGYCCGRRSVDSFVYVILPDYCVESTGRNFYHYGCESLHENYKTYGECSYMPFSHNVMMGFVKKGTPIIPKDLMVSIKATALATDNLEVSGDKLMREFIAANIEQLKTGKEFSYKELEEFGMLTIFDTVYPDDANNRRHKLGEVLGKYCKKRKGNACLGAYRNRYSLKPNYIREFL